MDDTLVLDIEDLSRGDQQEVCGVRRDLRFGGEGAGG